MDQIVYQYIEPKNQAVVSIQQIDASEFPTVKLYMSIKDKTTGNVIENLDDAFFYINKQDANAKYVKQVVKSANQLNEKEALKVDMVADVSGSMAVSYTHLNTRVSVESVEEKFETENRGTDKIQALFRYQTDKEEAWKRIRKVKGVEATGALENNIEVNAEGVHKGMALLKLGEIFGISREEIAAFGDGSNDTMMLKTVGMGVAMANAMPEVKAAADRLSLIHI